MTGPARVESIDVIRAFRASLFKFAEVANTALSDAEGEMSRTLVWLETEQLNYWQGQIRKRSEIVSRALEAVRQKKLFKDSSGRTPSAVDEEKALARAQRALAEAESKLVAVRQWTRKLEKEVNLYKGSVQRFATSVQVDIPAAGSRLDSMLESLDLYVTLKAEATEAAVAPAEGEAPPPPPVEEKEEPGPTEPPKTPEAGK